MKKILFLFLLIWIFTIPVSAEELKAPEAPNHVQQLLPQEQKSFGQDLWYVFTEGIQSISPQISAVVKKCCGLVGALMLLAILRNFSGIPSWVAELTGTVSVALILLTDTGTLIRHGADTVTQISEYGKLLFPVLTAALASQGGITSSAGIYVATAMFDSILCGLISRILIPGVYVYIALSVGCAAVDEQMVKKLKDLIKRGITWFLKTMLYIFTGYMAISGVISGTTDQAALKATKLTISGMVPVVGGILSDASEAVLVGAGLVKNTAGVYGMLAVSSIFIGPFLMIGLHYLALKFTAAVCGVFSDGKLSELIGDFSAAMGLLLAMTGTVCLLVMISTICFMKGMSG